jgi:hypothetical protein
MARDTAGNIGITSSLTYTIDTTLPTVTASPSGGTFSSTRSVTLSTSEPATIYYTINGNTPTLSSQVYSSPISISSTTTLKYFARDAAGNNGNVVTQVYAINTADTTVPSIVITQPAGDSTVSIASGQITVTGTASDSESGIGTVQLRVDEGSYATATPKAPGDWSTWSVTVSITAGQHRLVPRATDNAGNQAWNSIFITVNDSTTPPPPPPDPTAPDTRIDSVRDGTGMSISNGQTTTSRSITILFSSADTDVEVFEGRSNSGTWSPITSPLTLNGLSIGQNRYDVRARDTAGNVDNSPASITWTITVAPPPPPPSGGALDPFGIAMLYPTAPGTDNEYYTKTNAATTTERMSGFSRNADGTWNIDGGPRWVITGGWRNVEMTMQLKINSGSQVQFYANGEEHTTNNNGAWHGSANKMRMYADGRIGFVKELYHESGNSGYASTTAVRSSGQGSITGKWVTVKYVGYNIDDDTHRKLEGYISMNNDNKFIKVSELVDNGNWYASSGFDSFMAHMRQNYPSVVPENRDTGQEMKRNEVITWEGGFVSFRCDGANYDFRNVSVREISAENGLIDPSVVL